MTTASKIEFEIGLDVARLLSSVADLTAASKSSPELVARDFNMLSDAHTQLGRMLDRLSVKEAAE